MSVELRKALTHLSACLSDSRAENEVEVDLGTVYSAVADLVTSGGAGAIALASTLLFRSIEPPSLLAWIEETRNVAAHPELDSDIAIANARTTAFHIVVTVVEAVGARGLREHAQAIIQCCVSTARREYDSSAKVAAMAPLLLLMRTDVAASPLARRGGGGGGPTTSAHGDDSEGFASSGITDEDDAAMQAATRLYGESAREIAKMLLADWKAKKTGKKTSSQSVKGMLLQTMGVLLRFHAAAVGDSLVKEIARIAQHWLFEFIQKGAGGMLLEGCLRCVDGALSTEAGRAQLLATGPYSERPKLYRAVFVQTVVQDGHLTNVVSAALALASRHAHLFAAEIEAEPNGHVALIGRLAGGAPPSKEAARSSKPREAARSRNKGVAAAALRTLEAVFRLMNASALAARGTAAAPVHAARLEALAKLFNHIFKRADFDASRGVASETSDINVALCGCGNLAPAIAALTENSLKLVLSELLGSARESMRKFNRTRTLAMTLCAAAAVAREIRITTFSVSCMATRDDADDGPGAGIGDDDVARLCEIAKHLAWSYAYRGRNVGVGAKRNSQIAIARALRQICACTAPLEDEVVREALTAGGGAALEGGAPALRGTTGTGVGGSRGRSHGRSLRTIVATLIPTLFENTLDKLLDSSTDARDLGDAFSGIVAPRAVERRERGRFVSATMVTDEFDGALDDDDEGGDDAAGGGDGEGGGSRAAAIAGGGGSGHSVPDITALRLRVRVGFVPLWHDLLQIDAPCSSASANLIACGAPLPRSAAISASDAVYDELMRTALTRLKSLDLAVQAPQAPPRGGDEGEGEAEEDEENEGETAAMQPRNTRDYATFLAIVEFLTDVLGKRRKRRLMHWLPFFLETVIELARTYPHASGFLKLVEFAIHAGDALRFFDGAVEARGDEASSHGDAAGSGSEGEIRRHRRQAAAHCAAQLRDYLARDVVTQTVQRVDELLVVSLRCVLAAPPSLCLDVDAIVLPSLLAALELGVRHAPIASVALDSLERALTCEGRHVNTRELLAEHRVAAILPRLRYFLGGDKSNSDGDDAANLLGVGASDVDGGSGGAGRAIGVRGKAKGSAARDSASASIRGAVRAANAASTSTSGARKLRHRILRVIGLLGGAGRRATVPTAAALASVMRWSTRDEIRIDFQLGEAKYHKTVLPFDELLPHLIDLAQGGGRAVDGSGHGRQTRIAACELLHSLVVWMVGESANSGEERDGCFVPLYAHVFPAVLRLASDSDAAVCTIFCTLLAQLMRWFSSSRAKNCDTEALLAAATDGAATKNNLAMRKLCSTQLAEFFTYAIKQSAAEGRAASSSSHGSGRGGRRSAGGRSSGGGGNATYTQPLGVVALMRKLHGMVRHPSPHVRLGALSVVNKIYRAWREKEILVDLYAMDLLASSMTALRLADSDNAALGTSQAAEEAIGHLLKMLRRCTRERGDGSALYDENQQRIAFKGGMMELIHWVWKRVAAPQTLLRRCCWKILGDLVKPSLGDWIRKKSFNVATPEDETEAGSSSEAGRVLEEDSLRSALGGGGGLCGWMAHRGASLCVPPSCAGDGDALLDWMARVGAAADAYFWAIYQHHTDATYLFLAPGVAEKSSSRGAAVDVKEERQPLKRTRTVEGLDTMPNQPLLRAIAGALHELFDIAPTMGRSSQLQLQRYETEDDAAVRRGKHTLLRRIFRLLAVVLRRASSESERDALIASFDPFMDALLRAVTLVLLDPTRLRLSVSELEVARESDGEAAAKRVGAGTSALARAAQQLCTALRKSATLGERFHAVLADERAASHDARLHAIAIESHALEPARARWLIDGYRRLFKAGMLGDAAAQRALGESLGSAIVTGCSVKPVPVHAVAVAAAADATSIWSPMRKLVVGELLQLAVAMGWRVVHSKGYDEEAEFVQDLDGGMEIVGSEASSSVGCLLDACVDPTSELYELFQDAVDVLLAEKKRWRDVARSLLQKAGKPGLQRSKALKVLLALLQREHTRAHASRITPEAYFIAELLPHLDDVAASWSLVSSGVDMQRHALELLIMLLTLPRAEHEVETTRIAISKSTFARTAVGDDAGLFADDTPIAIRARAVKQVLPYFLPGTCASTPWPSARGLLSFAEDLEKPGKLQSTFPISKEEVVHGTTRYAEYQQLLDVLLKVLVQTGSIAMLSALVFTLARTDPDEGDVYKSDLQPDIERMVDTALGSFAHRVESKGSSPIAVSAFVLSIVFSRDLRGINPLLRRRLTDRILFPLLTAADDDAAVQILTMCGAKLIADGLLAKGNANYASKPLPAQKSLPGLINVTLNARSQLVAGNLDASCYSIISMVCVEIGAKLAEPGVTASSRRKYTAQIRRRIVAFRILEATFEKLPAAEFEHKKSPRGQIAEAFDRALGGLESGKVGTRGMRVFVVKAAKAVLFAKGDHDDGDSASGSSSSGGGGDGDVQEIEWEHRCAALGALTSLARKTFLNGKLFNSHIWVHSIKKQPNELKLWRAVSHPKAKWFDDLITDVDPKNARSVHWVITTQPKPDSSPEAIENSREYEARTRVSSSIAKFEGRYMGALDDAAGADVSLTLSQEEFVMRTGRVDALRYARTQLLAPTQDFSAVADDDDEEEDARRVSGEVKMEIEGGSSAATVTMRHSLSSSSSSATPSSSSSDATLLYGGSVHGSSNSSISSTRGTTQTERFELSLSNRHPAMASLLSTLDVQKPIVDQELAEADSRGLLPNETAAHLDRIRNVFEQLSSNGWRDRNARLLILRIVINRPHLFKRDAEKWFPLIVDFMLQLDDEARTQNRDGLHCILRDVLLLISIPDDKNEETGERPMEVPLWKIVPSAGNKDRTDHLQWGDNPDLSAKVKKLLIVVITACASQPDMSVHRVDQYVALVNNFIVCCKIGAGKCNALQIDAREVFLPLIDGRVAGSNSPSAHRGTLVAIRVMAVCHVHGLFTDPVRDDARVSRMIVGHLTPPARGGSTELYSAVATAIGNLISIDATSPSCLATAARQVITHLFNGKNARGEQMRKGMSAKKTTQQAIAIISAISSRKGTQGLAAFVDDELQQRIVVLLPSLHDSTTLEHAAKIVLRRARFLADPNAVPSRRDDASHLFNALVAVGRSVGVAVTQNVRVVADGGALLHILLAPDEETVRIGIGIVEALMPVLTIAQLTRLLRRDTDLPAEDYERLRESADSLLRAVENGRDEDAIAARKSDLYEEGDVIFGRQWSRGREVTVDVGGEHASITATKDADPRLFAEQVLALCDLVLDAPEQHDVSLQRIFRKHSSAFCRNAMYDLLSNILRDASLVWKNPAAAAVVAAHVIPLLRDGLVDDSAMIRAMLLDFFHGKSAADEEEVRSTIAARRIMEPILEDAVTGAASAAGIVRSASLPAEPHARLLMLTQTMYMPHSEQAWLHCAAELMAKLTERWFKYDKRIFLQGLDEHASYDSLNVSADYGWSGASAFSSVSSTPLFSQALASERKVLIQSTQQFAWTQTQTQQGGGGVGLQFTQAEAAASQGMTMMDLDDDLGLGLAVSGLDGGAHVETVPLPAAVASGQVMTTALPFNMGSSPAGSIERKGSAGRVRFESPTAMRYVNPQLRASGGKAKRRGGPAAFVGNVGQIGTALSLAATAVLPSHLASMGPPARVNREMRKRTRERQRRERQRRLTALRPKLFRTYRKGELPDIQIPYSAIYGPLATLCRLDPSVASWFLKEVSRALLQLPSNESEAIEASIARGGSASSRGGSQSSARGSSTASAKASLPYRQSSSLSVRNSSTQASAAQTATAAAAADLSDLIGGMDADDEAVSLVSVIDTTFQLHLVEAVHAALELSRGDVAATTCLLRICHEAVRANDVVDGMTKLRASALQLELLVEPLVRKQELQRRIRRSNPMWQHEGEEEEVRSEVKRLEKKTSADAQTRQDLLDEIEQTGKHTFGDGWSGGVTNDGMLRIQAVRMADTEEHDWQHYLEFATRESDPGVLAENLIVFCQDAPGALQPHLIRRAALDSGAFHAAVPILEWIATRYSSGRCETAPVWAELGAVYAALGEHDARLAVLQKSTIVRATMEGVQCEAENDFKRADRGYRQAQKAGTSAGIAEQDMWYYGRLRCSRALRKWGKVHGDLRNDRIDALGLDEVDSSGELPDVPPNEWNKTLWEAPVRSTMVPLYVSALLRLGSAGVDTEEGGKGESPEAYEEELREFVESSTLRPAWRSWMESNVATLPLFALLAATGRPADYAAAAASVEIGYDTLLSRVASLHPLATAAQSQMLQTLQQLADTDDVACAMRRGCTSKRRVMNHAALADGRSEPGVYRRATIGNASLRGLLLQWVPSLLVEGAGAAHHSGAFILQNRMPSPRHDPSQLWQDVADARTRCLLHIDRELTRADFAADAIERLAVTEVCIRLKIATAAGLQRAGAAHAALKYIREAESAYRASGLRDHLRGDGVRSSNDCAALLELELLRIDVGIKQTRAKHEMRADVREARRFATQCVGAMGESELSEEICPRAWPLPIDTSDATLRRARSCYMLRASTLRTFASAYAEAEGATEGTSAAFTALSHAASISQMQQERRAGREEACGVAVDNARRDDEPEDYSPELALALFCVEQLSRRGGGSDDALTEGELAKAATTQLLRAVRIGGSVGRAATERLPMIFRLLHTHYAEASVAWDDGIGEVPCWAFVRWVPQLMGLLTQREGGHVLPLLERLAAEYPGAIVYPFALTRATLAAKRSEAVDDRDRNRSLRRGNVGMLPQVLGRPLLRRFVAALAQLREPHQRLKDAITSATDAIPASATKDAQRRATATFAAEFDAIFGDEIDGTYTKEYAKTHVGEVAAIFKTQHKKAGGKPSSKKRRRDGRAWTEAGFSDDFVLTRKILIETKKAIMQRDKNADKNYSSNLIDKRMFPLRNFSAQVHKKYTAKPELQLYSRWLAEFDGSAQLDEPGIEMPGVWSHYSEVYERPRVDSHASIVSFLPTLLSMSSKEIPKRLGVLLSDGTTRYLLVKGGEDLRLDQRILQSFSVMNAIWSRDAASSRRGLAVETYAVVPMGESVGVIEWVGNTEPLKAVIEDGLRLYNARAEEKKRRRGGGRGRRGRGKVQTKPKIELHNMAACTAREDWLEKKKGKKAKSRSNERYLQIYVSETRETVLSLRTQMDKSLREAGAAEGGGFILRRIAAMTSGAESFIATRSHFARSIAALSMASYILGIGDRHLDNFLLSSTSGCVIPIDFGVAFSGGVALPVPELLPFRLGPQFTQVLEPLQGEGSLARRSMVHSLGALRAPRARELLLATLDVFVREPTVQWAAKARNTAARIVSTGATVVGGDVGGEAGADGEDAFAQWPEKKINSVRRKLLGYNPAAIMAEEFKREQHRVVRKFSGATKQIVRCMWGEEGNSRRSQPDVRDGECDVATQVELLCEMATDPNITTRQWQGLVAWL